MDLTLRGGPPRDVDCLSLSDRDLRARLRELARAERRLIFHVLCHLAEFDRRELWKELGFPSLFAYCIRELAYSEDAAAARIRTARAMRGFPLLRERLRAGSLSLSAARLLCPHLTEENHRALLDKAAGGSVREIERIVAALAPRPDPRDCVRILSATRRDDASAAPAHAAASATGPMPPPLDSATLPTPLPPSAADAETDDLLGTGRTPAPPEERARVAFCAGSGLLAKLERARSLLRHRFPAARLEQVFEAALDALLDTEDPQRRLARKARRAERKKKRKRPPPASGAAAASKPSGAGAPRSRRIPQAVKDAAWARDGGRCTYLSPEGHRCGARDWLEYGHIRPWALGGSSDLVENVRLLCRTHNQMLAHRRFGDKTPR